jgi:hypothetical protein
VGFIKSFHIANGQSHFPFKQARRSPFALSRLSWFYHCEKLFLYDIKVKFYFIFSSVYIYICFYECFIS